MADLLARGLREEGYAADVAGTGEDALWMARAVDYDAIVLDVMLPGVDGMETCRSLRAAGVWSPVLMLTARDAVGDRIAGLDAGADDYVLKPFSFGELLARLRALVRRAPHERPTVVQVGDLRLDPATRRAWRGETTSSSSPAKAFALLEAFMRRPGQVLSREQLLDAAWDMAFESRSNIVDVYVRSLRDADRRGQRSRPFAVSATASGRTADDLAPSDPRAAGPAVRARHGARARCDRLLHLPARRLDAARIGRPEPARHRPWRRPSTSPGGAASSIATRPAARRSGSSSARDGRVRETTPAGLPGRSSPARRSASVLAGRTRPSDRRDPGRRRRVADPGGAGTRAAARRVVVAASLESREETLDRLLRQFLIGGPLALAIVTLAGYLLAASALRPVEAMRRRAASIGASTPGARLPLAAKPGRALAARRDAERDARAARVGGRARASLRRRREPRAADAAGACCAPSSSSRSGIRDRRRSSSGPCDRRPRTPTGSAGSPRISCSSPATTRGSCRCGASRSRRARSWADVAARFERRGA